MDGEIHRFHAIIRILQESGRWLLVALLIFAPWAFGATQPWAISWVVAGMDACAAMALGSVMVRTFASRRVSLGGVPWVAALLAVTIMLTGWSAAWNAQSYFDPHLLKFVTATRWLRFWPSSVDAQATKAAMERLSALLLVVLVSAHAAQSPTWRRRLLMTIASTGISIAFFGLAQKTTHAPLLFWNAGNYGETVFATYRYHANAGAYLNCVWPICGALAMDAFARRGTRIQRAVWLPCTFIVLAGVALNVSKGAHLVAVLLLAGLLLAAAISCFEMKGSLQWSKVLGGALVTAAIVGTAIVIGFQPVASRWTEFFRRDPGSEGRIWMAHACMDMIRDRPWCGFGPGTFALVFPFYSRPYGDSLSGVWRYAHSDYLQMLVDWGALGCAPWAVLIGGGLIRTLRRVSRRGGESDGSPEEGSGGDHWDGQRERSADGQSTTSAAIMFQGTTRERGGTERARGSRPMDLAVVLSLCGLLIHAAFDFPLQIASIQLYFAVLLGCAWREKARRKIARGSKAAEVAC